MASQPVQATVQMQQKKGRGLGMPKKQAASNKGCRISTNKYDIVARENATMSECDVTTAQAGIRRVFSLIKGLPMDSFKPKS